MCLPSSAGKTPSERSGNPERPRRESGQVLNMAMDAAPSSIAGKYRAQSPMAR